MTMINTMATTYDDTMSIDRTVNTSNVSDADVASIDKHDDNPTFMDVPTEVPVEVPTHNEPNFFEEVDDVDGTHPDIAVVDRDEEFRPEPMTGEPAIAPR
jgi:hypothetical protein